MDKLEWAKHYKKESEDKDKEIKRLRIALYKIAHSSELRKQKEMIQAARQALKE